MEKYKDYMDNPEYEFVPYNSELEGGEEAVMPNGESVSFEGASHEASDGQGVNGIPTNLPENTRIFSDRLKHNGRTFAKTVKPINSKIAKLEKQLETDPNDKLKQNSVTLMNQQLDHYFNEQEELKQNNEMKRSIKYAKGGTIPKYPDGGGFGSKIDWANKQLQLKPVFSDMSGVDPNEVPDELNPQSPLRINNSNLTDADLGLNSKYASVSETPLSFKAPDLTGAKNFIGDNAGTIGQIGTAALTAGLQNRNLNKLKAPRSLSNVNLTSKLGNPNLVDYSAERNAIDQGYLASADSATRNLSNSATAQAFKNQANLARLHGTGQSWQNQENTNTQIKNQFQQQRNEAGMKEAMINNDIDKYNLENKYNYDAFKTGQKGALLGQVGNVGSQVFGNMTNYKNQLDQAGILATGRDKSVNATLYGNGESARKYYGSLNDSDKKVYNSERVKQGMEPFTNGGLVGKRSLINTYKDGGTIHIKPENKGKFNATKKATGKSTEELTHSKNPVTKKRAIFAQNAAKWKK